MERWRIECLTSSGPGLHGNLKNQEAGRSLIRETDCINYSMQPPDYKFIILTCFNGFQENPDMSRALFSGVLAVALGCTMGSADSAVLTQNFEPGEVTTDWGSMWTDGATEPTFLDPAFGGTTAGTGTSATQSFSRSFRSNLVGLDVASDPYTISMYVQLDAFDGPAGGLFEIIDGDYGGGANAANLRILTEDLGGGEYAFIWQAADEEDGWVDLGIELELSTPYHVEFIIDPHTFTYSASVEQVDGFGNVIASGGASGLNFNENVITNGQNGNLRFYVQASAGGTEVAVDNINISGVPEPSIMGLVLLALLGAAGRKFRKKT